MVSIRPTWLERLEPVFTVLDTLFGEGHVDQVRAAAWVVGVAGVV